MSTHESIFKLVNALLHSASFKNITMYQALLESHDVNQCYKLR